MRVYENDNELKIPKWYLKLPMFILQWIGDMGIVLSAALSRKRISRTNKRNIKFYYEGNNND